MKGSIINKPSELTVLLLGLYGIAAIEKYLVLKKKGFGSKSTRKCLL